MTAEETVRLFNLIKLTYPRFLNGFTPEQKKAKVKYWQMTFGEVSFPVMQMAFELHRRRMSFEPSDAEMFKALAELNGAAFEDAVRAQFSGDSALASKARWIMEQTERFKRGEKEIKIAYNALAPELFEKNSQKKLED